MDTLIYQLLTLAQQFLAALYSSSKIIIEFVTMPVGDLIYWYAPDPTFANEIVGSILNTIGIGSYSLLTLMFGAGIGIYLLYQFITWVLNILT